MKLKEFGFSLAEVLVAIGIATGASMALMQMIKVSSKAMKNTETKQEMNVVNTYIHQLLLNQSACKNTLTSAGDLSTSSSKSLASIKTQNGSVAFSTGKKDGNNTIKIEDIKLKTQYDENTKTYTPGNLVPKGDVNSVTIEVKYKKLSKLTNKSVLTKRFPLQVVTDATTGAVKDCYSQLHGAVDTAKAQSCLSIGGIFDASTNKCDLSNFPATTDKPSTAVSVNYLEGSIQQALNTSIKQAIDQAISNYNSSSVQPYLLKNRSCPSGQYMYGMSSNGTIRCKVLPVATNTNLTNNTNNTRNTNNNTNTTPRPPTNQTQRGPCPGGDTVIGSVDGSNSCQFSWRTASIGQTLTVGSGVTSSSGGAGSITCNDPGGNAGWSHAYHCPSKKGNLSCNGGRIVSHSPDGSNQCALNFPQVSVGTYKKINGTNGGWAKGTCLKKSATVAEWDYLSSCPNKQGKSCPSGAMDVPSKSGGAKCRCSWNAISGGKSLSVSCSRGGKISANCSKKTGSWLNVSYTCP